MITNLARWIAVAAVVASVATAQAVILPVSQSRSVSASAFGMDASGSYTDLEDHIAPDFLPWNRSAAASILTSFISSNGWATQTSSISDFAMIVSGQSDALATVYDPFKESANGNSRTTYDVSFQVDQPTPIYLEGDTYGNWIGYGGAGGYVRLTHPGGTVFETNYGSETFATEATLEPGRTYRFLAEASSSAFTFDQYSAAADASVNARLFINSVSPDNFVVPLGSELSGNLESLKFRDQDELYILNDPDAFVAQVVISAVSPVQSPNGMCWTMTSRVELANLVRRVELFDWQAVAWVTVNMAVAPQFPDEVAYDVSTGAARFVEPFTGKMLARVTWTASEDITGRDGYAHVVDQVRWLMR